jgi:hypothetical protein
MSGDESMMNLGGVLRAWRRGSDKTLAEASREIGVSLPTLQRLEVGVSKGEGKRETNGMDGRTIAKVICWLLTDAGSGE